MRRALLLLFLVGSDCDDSDFDPVVDLTGNCATGLHASSGSNLVVTTLLLDNVALVASFDSTADYTEGAAACIDDAGNNGIFLFEGDGSLFGSVTVAHSGSGVYDLTEGTIDVSVDLFGAVDPVLFSSTDWVDGSASVEEELTQFRVELQGSAETADGRTLVLQAQLELAP